MAKFTKLMVIVKKQEQFVSFMLATFTAVN